MPLPPLMVQAHAWLMVVGWSLIACGIVVARCLKDNLGSPLWFQVHRAVQVTGLACAATGFILIFAEVGSGTPYTRLSTAASASPP